MDIIIVLVGAAFIGFIGIFGYQYLDEYQRRAADAPRKKAKDLEREMLGQLKRKLAAAEETIKKREAEMAAASLELTQTKQREKELIDEKSRIAFDSRQYEKFQKDFRGMKKELTVKEEALEREISEHRKETSMLSHLKRDHENIKRELGQTQDTLNKSQLHVEKLTKELDTAKKTIRDQEKIVKEHSENKKEGEWVSRGEFEKLERELKEKEAMIQKLLSLKAEKNV